MRLVTFASAIMVYCTSIKYASAQCQDVEFGGVSTPAEGRSYILIKTPNYGDAMSLKYNPDDYMNELNKMMSWLCWDIYLCSGISRAPELRAEFAVMCWDRTKAAIQTAKSEEEALRLTEDNLNYWTRLSRSEIDPDVWFAEELAKESDSS